MNHAVISKIAGQFTFCYHVYSHKLNALVLILVVDFGYIINCCLLIVEFDVGGSFMVYSRQGR
jgi:hypothetical protein